MWFLNNYVVQLKLNDIKCKLYLKKKKYISKSSPQNHISECFVLPSTYFSSPWRIFRTWMILEILIQTNFFYLFVFFFTRIKANCFLLALLFHWVTNKFLLSSHRWRKIHWHMYNDLIILTYILIINSKLFIYVFLFL